MGSVTVLILTLLGLLCSDAIRIDISPANCIAGLQNEVHISCSTDGVDNGTKVTQMELSRNDEDPIVFVSSCGDVGYGQEHLNKFRATVGKTDKADGRSYLDVTVLNPESKDTGIYTCVQYQIDKFGRFKKEMASKDLFVENMNVSSISTILNQMKNKITALERKCSDSDDKTKNDAVAFLASPNGVTFPPLNNVVFQLPNVIVKKGTGYDPKTSVFTAPVSGIYAFSLSIYLQNACTFDAYLIANKQALSHCGGVSTSGWTKSSTSSVGDLRSGDRVFVKMRTTNCKFHGNPATMFSGFLVKAT